MLKEWIFNEVAAEHICKLVNTDAEMIGEDMEVTSVESHLGIGIAYAGSSDYLITRRASRGVVAEALGVPSEFTKAIVGSPGIGKSWTLLYALQQELLYNGACVLFLTPKIETARVYIRQRNHIYAWSTFLNGTSNLFKDRNCLVLLDPKEAIKGGAEITNGERRAIYAASNNAKHFDPDMTKRDPDAMLHLSPPSMEEVCVALPYMLSDQEQFHRATVLDRVNVIGPLPQWLMSERLFQSQKMKIDNAVENMKREELERLLSSDGLVTGKVTLPGSVYAVSAERMTAVGGDFVEIGYDGSGLMYPVRKLSYLSKYVSRKVAVAKREIVLSYVGVADVSERSSVGLAVESIFWDDLKKGGRFQAYNMKEKMDCDFQIACNLSWSDNCAIAELATVLDNDRQVTRVETGGAAIDFAGPGRRVYQVTVSRDRSFELGPMENLLVACGYLIREGKGVRAAPQAATLPKLSFYWAVPYSIATSKTWKGKAAKKFKKTEAPVVQTALDTHVDQFVLTIGQEPPQGITGIQQPPQCDNDDEEL
jgi:hypothetical protein